MPSALAIVPTPRLPGAGIALEAFLSHIEPFRHLDAARLRSIAAATTQLNVPRGTAIFRRGDPCRGVHFLILGQVKLVMHAPQGSEKVLELVGPGQSLAKEAVFLDRPYAVTAETLAESHLVHIPRASLMAELERSPGFARNFIVKLSRRVEQLRVDLESFTLRSGTARVAGYLLAQLPPHRGEANDPANPAIHLPATKGVIASCLNLTQEHFSRILRDLETAGLITIHGRQIAILDRDRLRAQAA